MKLNFDERPLSWSCISSFEYNPETWYKKYVLNEKETETKELAFGKAIGEKLEKDPTFLPMIERHSKMEHIFNVSLGGIKLTGRADSFCTITNRKLGEYKTGKKVWDQKRADEYGQITLYCLLNYITNKVKPEDMEIDLVWLPTQETGDFRISFVEPIEKTFKVFRTKRTMLDILMFGAYIKEVVKQMETYVDNSPLTPKLHTI